MNKPLFYCTLAILAVIALAAAMLRDGGSHTFSYTGPDHGDPVLLTFFGFKYEPENVVMMEQLLSGFMEANPDVNVVYESIKGADYYPVLRKRLETGNGDDMFMIDHDTMLGFSRRGFLVDLAGLPETAAFADMTLTQVREHSGEIFSLPTSISAFGLYCNLDLLKRYKIAVPATYREFLDACRVFAEAGLTPIVANNDISLKTLVMARGLYKFYQEPDSASRFAAVNAGTLPLSGYFRSGLELLKLLCDRGYIDTERTLATRKTRDDLADFASGDHPFMLTGAWASARLRTMADFAYTVVPYPVQDDGSVLVINIDTRLAINVDSPHVPEATRLLRHMVSRPAVQRFADSQSSLSPLKNSARPTDPAVRNLAASLESGRFLFGADARFHFPIWNISRQCSLMILQGASVDEALRYLDQAVSDAAARGA